MCSAGPELHGSVPHLYTRELGWMNFSVAAFILTRASKSLLIQQDSEVSAVPMLMFLALGMLRLDLHRAGSSL